jgi:hypothetical protein
MPSDMTRRRASRPARSARRLLLIFATTILTPGVILAGFGLRALTQERQNAERDARNTLEGVANDLGRRLELDLRDWQQAAAVRRLPFLRNGYTDIWWNSRTSVGFSTPRRLLLSPPVAPFPRTELSRDLRWRVRLAERTDSRPAPGTCGCASPRCAHFG